MIKAEKTASDGTVTFTQENAYDQDGIRISKTEGNTTKYYYYDRGTVVSTKAGSAITTSNVIGIENNVIGTVRDEENDNSYYIYDKDIQGSTTSIISENGSVAASYDYSDFGETSERKESSIENEICYTGAIYDGTTSLYYLNARYYDPRIGRFISEDTYRGETNNYDQWHLYAYCANNPINYTDPTGHIKIKTWLSTIVIDSILTICAGWWKWSYDVVGKTFRTILNRKGIKSLSQKLLGQVPKVIGTFSKFKFQIRKAIRCTIGYTIRIGTSAGFTNGIYQFVNRIKTFNYKTICYIATSITSLGGLISVVLDYISDKKFDGTIKL